MAGFVTGSVVARPPSGPSTPENQDKNRGGGGLGGGAIAGIVTGSVIAFIVLAVGVWAMVAKGKGAGGRPQVHQVGGGGPSKGRSSRGGGKRK